MSDIFRKIARRFKKDKGYPTAAHPSGHGTADPRSRSQASLHLHVGHQPTPDPLSGSLSTPNLHCTDQRINDPSAGGQNTLETPSDQGDHPSATQFIGWSIPDQRSSGQPIDEGIYTITNVHHNNVVRLENSDANEPLRGHYNPENRNAQWRVKPWGNERYTIDNVEHNHYAICSPLAGLKASVEGHSRDQPWRIRARPTGEYTIATTDTGNLWMLPYDDVGTPVELFNVHTDRRCWWTFKKQENGALPNERVTIEPAFFEPTPLLIPSRGQRTPDPHPSSKRGLGTVDFLDVASVITEATDLLLPLRAACRALKVVLETAEAQSIGYVNKDPKALINVLKIHLATVENHIMKLEEDQNIDEITPKLNQEIGELLETYARELKGIYELLFEKRFTSLCGKYGRSNAAADGAIRAGRHVLQAAIRVPFLCTIAVRAYTATEWGHPSRIKRSNAYGIQHGECLQGTREKTLGAIRSWVDDERTEKWIFFFLDVAGSGKSTVAKNMAEEWKREKRLLARFFFSRDTTETMSTNSFCSTVAGAFADLDPNFKAHLDEFTKRPNVGLLPFEDQFEGLVVGPLRSIGRHAILVIDALDECDAEQRDELLGTLHAKHGSIPLLRIFATGRPERDIKRWAEEKFEFGFTHFTRLEGSDKDVELYINHRLQDLPIAQERLYPVIRHAEGLFIWARVACDLLVDSDDIESLLEELGKEVSLDYLYKVALEQSMPKEGASRRAMVLVLQMILAAREPLSIAELEMLSPKPGVVEKVVTRLGSVLLYQGREAPIRLLHATFREFITARSKADIFFIQPELGHHTLASGCLNAISHVLKQDETTLRNPDTIFDKKAISLLARSLLTVFLGLLFTRQTHGSIIVH